MSDLRDNLTRNDRRAYGRLKAGLSYHNDKKVRFVTFTFPMALEKAKRAMRLQSVIKWIRKEYGHLEYFATHTDEGNGVFHLAIVNNVYIPRDDLISAWEKRTGAWNVGISLVAHEDEFPPGKFFQEMIRQSDIDRYSYSSGWLRPGSRTYMTKCYKAFVLKSTRIQYFERWNTTGLDELPDVRIYQD